MIPFCEQKSVLDFCPGAYSCFVSLDWFSCKKAGIWTNGVVSWEDTMFLFFYIVLVCVPIIAK